MYHHPSQKRLTPLEPSPSFEPVTIAEGTAATVDTTLSWFEVDTAAEDTSGAAAEGTAATAAGTVATAGGALCSSSQTHR